MSPQRLPLMMNPMHPLLKPMPHPGFVPNAAQAAASNMVRNAAMNQMAQMAHVHDIYGQSVYNPDFNVDGSMRKKKKTGGRKHGSQGYTKQDVKHLLDLIDALKPVDREGWEQINMGYNRYAQANDRQDREPENLKKKFMSLVNFKPTGDQEVPEDVRRAKKIHHQIEPQSMGEEEELRFRKRKLPESGLVDLRGWVPNGTPNKEQLKMLISQLASQHQHNQAQQQQAHQQLAQQLSMQFMQQQQQHKAVMIGMASSLMHNTRQLPGLRNINLPPLPPSGDWGSAANAAAAAAASAAAASIKTLTIEEWTSTVNAESLSSSMKDSILEGSKAHGLTTVKELIDALDNPMEEVHKIFDFKPVEIARLKKTLGQLVLPTKEENGETVNIPLPPAMPQLGGLPPGLRPLPMMPSSHPLYSMPQPFNGPPPLLPFSPLLPASMPSLPPLAQSPLPFMMNHQPPPFHHLTPSDFPSASSPSSPSLDGSGGFLPLNSSLEHLQFPLLPPLHMTSQQLSPLSTPPPSPSLAPS